MAASRLPAFTYSMASPYRAKLLAGSCATMLFKTSIRRESINATIPAMACPFFCPTGLLGEICGPYPPPLGDLYRGVCQVDGASPDERTQSDLCNMGYAMERCRRFPGDAPDAVRFAVRPGDGEVLTLAYSVEKDHMPFMHGELRHSSEGIMDCPDVVLRRQAEAYAASYLR